MRIEKDCRCVVDRVRNVVLIDERDFFGKGQQGLLLRGEKLARFPPCRNQMQALVGLAILSGFLGVHVDEVRAAVELRARNLISAAWMG
jgi:hypothetical protein